MPEARNPVSARAIQGFEAVETQDAAWIPHNLTDF